MSKKKNFKIWEVLLATFSAVVVLGSLYYLISDQKLYPLLLGMKDKNSQEPVIGAMGAAQGDVSRQGAQSASFNRVAKSENLLNEDTVFTGPQATATVVMLDGTSIELGPNTMVKLEVEQNLGFQGITRSTSVNIISGNVTAAAKSDVVLKSNQGEVKVEKDHKEAIKVIAAPTIKAKPKIQEVRMDSVPAAAPAPVTKAATPRPTVTATPTPVPSPSPTATPTPTPSPKPTATPVRSVEANLLSPTHGKEFHVPKGAREVKVPFDAKISSDSILVQVILKKSGETIFNKIVKPVHQKISEMLSFSEPGEYEIELHRKDGGQWSSPLEKTQSTFKVSDVIEAIELKPAEIGGQKINDVGKEVIKDFEVTLGWSAYPGATGYTLTVVDEKNPNTVLFEQKLKETQYSFFLSKIGKRSFKYRVSASDQSNFKVFSRWDLFNFVVQGPSVTAPEKNSKMRADKPILLAWKKISFSEVYDVEVYTDEALSNPVKKLRHKENFYFLRDMTPGTYYFRVRSVFNGNTPGPYSTVVPFTLQ